MLRTMYLDETIIKEIVSMREKLKAKNPTLKITNSIIVGKALDEFKKGGYKIA